MNPIRRTACEICAILTLCFLIEAAQGWLLDQALVLSYPSAEVSDEFALYNSLMEQAWNELVYFPVPASSSNEGATVSMTNTWQALRTYGGERPHEGTDLMADIDQAGYYPVVSMTDGTVEKVGWLEKGGYRIGIRSEHQIYYYYAHLDSYAEDWKCGDPVQAGTLLGYMGDTGYGPEGTKGQFAVHLHVGVYLPIQESDQAVNPYWFLKYLENHKLTYSY